MLHSGRPSDVVNENSLTTVRVILEDQRVTISVQGELVEEHFVDVSCGTMHTIPASKMLLFFETCFCSALP